MTISGFWSTLVMVYIILECCPLSKPNSYLGAHHYVGLWWPSQTYKDMLRLVKNSKEPQRPPKTTNIFWRLAKDSRKSNSSNLLPMSNCQISSKPWANTFCAFLSLYSGFLSLYEHSCTISQRHHAHLAFKVCRGAGPWRFIFKNPIYSTKPASEAW